MEKLKKKIKKNTNSKAAFLSPRIKNLIAAVFLFVLAILFFLSFFDKAKQGGKFIFIFFNFLVGKTVFFIPLFLILIGLLLIKPQERKIFIPVFAGSIILILALSGLMEILDTNQERAGGILGYGLAWPFLKFFGNLASIVLFLSLIFISFLILWDFIPQKLKKDKEVSEGIAGEEIKKQEKTKQPFFKLNLPKLNLEKTDEKKESQKIPFQIKNKKEIFAQEFNSGYKVPPIEFLSTFKQTPLTSDIKNTSLIIQKTLANFGIPVEMGEVNVGPTVTQYTLAPTEGVKITKITVLNNDLALALAAHPIRIEAPIPGKSLVGIEVPNKERALVGLRELISQSKFQESEPLVFALGENVSGISTFGDLQKMPHLLVAGSTGAGKTIFLQSLIVSLIWRNSPQTLRLILIDPKRVEFPIYNSLPHLLTPVVFDAQKAIQVLNWLVKEMERRFKILSEVQARDIQSFNKKISGVAKLEEEYGIMPYFVVIIDELADLMAIKGKEAEAGIIRLSQLARAVGIHLVLATQRPSVDVITGLIKANFTSRIAFLAASQVDSRTILDTTGAENLLGNGDMLFLSSEIIKPKRIQGCFVSQKEVQKVIDFIQKENKPQEQEEEEIKETLSAELENTSEEISEEIDYDDLLYEDAKKIVFEYKKASASLLQRRLKIGYARAARLLDILENRGIIGPGEGAKPREVYLDRQDKNLDFEI